jgi:hypothetical protein
MTKRGRRTALAAEHTSGVAATGWLQSYADRKRMSTIGQERPVAASESGRSTFDMRGEYRRKQFVERSPLDERLVLTRLLKSALDFLDEVLVAFKGNVVLTWLPKT